MSKLNLVTVRAAQDRRHFWSLWFQSRMELREFSAQEILNKVSDPNTLIQQYGLRRVISFYEESLLPTLWRLPKRKESWRAKFEVGCQLIQMRLQAGSPVEAFKLIPEMLADLAQAQFAPNPKADGEVRNQVRSFLIPILTEITRQLSVAGEATAALKAGETLERLQSLDRPQRSEYANLLWKSRDLRPSSLIVYLRHLTNGNWKTTAKPQLQEMEEFVRGQLAIDESVPVSEIPTRLLLNQAVVCAPNGPSFCLRNIGVGYLCLDKAERALHYLERALAVDGNDGGATSFYLGKAFFETEDFRKARHAFEQAAAQGFKKSRIAAWQGLAYARKERYDDALKTFRSAENIGAESLDAEFYIHWARASFLMGQVVDAEAHFRQALEKNDNDWRARYGLAICLERNENRKEAVKELRVATGSAEAAPAFYLLGRLLQAEKQIAEAASNYRLAVALNPTDLEYCLALGSSLDFRTNADALSYLEKAARGHRGGAEVLRRLALGWLSRDSHERAAYWMELFESECPFSPAAARLNARMIAVQATRAFNAGDFADATQKWTKVVAILDDEPRAKERLALALVSQATAQLSRGEFDGVEQKIAAAERLSPGVETTFLHGISSFIHGDFQIASEKLSSLAPTFNRPELSSLIDVASLLSIGDRRLSGCLRSSDDHNESDHYLLGSIKSGLTKIVSHHLRAAAPAQLEDDLPWPAPPDPIELEFEPLEKAILREK